MSKTYISLHDANDLQAEATTNTVEGTGRRFHTLRITNDGFSLTLFYDSVYEMKALKERISKAVTKAVKDFEKEVVK